MSGCRSASSTRTTSSPICGRRWKKRDRRGGIYRTLSPNGGEGSERRGRKHALLSLADRFAADGHQPRLGAARAVALGPGSRPARPHRNDRRGGSGGSGGGGRGGK